jgi:hypothetical protein
MCQNLEPKYAEVTLYGDVVDWQSRQSISEWLIRIWLVAASPFSPFLA